MTKEVKGVHPEIQKIGDKFSIKNHISYVDCEDVEVRCATLESPDKGIPFMDQVKPLMDQLPSLYIQDYLAKLMITMKEFGTKSEEFNIMMTAYSKEIMKEAGDEEIEFKFFGGRLLINKNLLMHGPEMQPLRGIFSVVQQRVWIPPVTQEKLAKPTDHSTIYNSFKLGTELSPLFIHIMGRDDKFGISPKLAGILNTVGAELKAEQLKTESYVRAGCRAGGN